jgi:hypothetical protein
MARARTTLAGIEQELTELQAALGPDAVAGQPPVETPEESAERQQINAARQAIAAQHDQQAKHYRATLDRLNHALAALPEPYGEQRLIDAQTAMEQAAQSVAAAEQAHLAAVRDAETLGAVVQQATVLAGRQAHVANRIAKVETELGNWNLFAKCMGNDGLIALAIDDAGPALSGLANDLLLACYGPRFTVSIQTLVETGKGEQKEGFDILVHDGESGESKSVGLMSGRRTGVDQRVPDPGGGTVPRPAHGATLWRVILGRGRWAAGRRTQAHVHGDEAGGAAPRRLSTGVLRVADAGTDCHGGCGDRSDLQGQDCHGFSGKCLHVENRSALNRLFNPSYCLRHSKITAEKASSEFCSWAAQQGTEG